MKGSVVTLLNSWKKSLQLLKPSSLKQLVKDTVSILPRVYIDFLKFIPVITILMAALILCYTFLTHVLIAHYVVIAILSILSAFTVIVVYAIVKDVLNHEPFSFKKHKYHLIIGTCVLTLFFALVYFYLMYGLIELTSLLAESRARIQELMAKKGISDPIYAKYGKKLFIDMILTMLVFIFAYIQVFLNLPGFIYLYFMDSQGLITEFFKAIYKGIKFLFYNLPGLTIIYGFFYVLSIAIAYLLRDVELHPLILVLISLLSIPLAPAINGELYKRLKV